MAVEESPKQLPQQHGRPDTAAMTMKQVFALRKWRELFTATFNKIKFTRSTTIVCVCCGTSHIHFDGYVNREGVRVPPRDEPILTTRLVGEPLCSDCFAAHWTNYKWVNLKLADAAHPGAGSPHSGIPGSQRSYDGGNFHTGEW